MPIPGFLTKTFEIFSSEEYADCCGWGPDGTTIVVKKIEQFSKRVLPKYFKHANFQSFVRQLNMYDFRKTVQDPSNGEFQHQFFQRDRPDLLTFIKRKANSSNEKKIKGPSTHPMIEQSIGEQYPLFGDDIVSESDSLALEVTHQRYLREEFQKKSEARLSHLEEENVMLKHLFVESHKKNIMMQERMERILGTMIGLYIENNGIGKPLPLSDKSHDRLLQDLHYIQSQLKNTNSRYSDIENNIQYITNGSSNNNSNRYLALTNGDAGININNNNTLYTPGYVTLLENENSNAAVTNSSNNNNVDLMAQNSFDLLNLPSLDDIPPLPSTTSNKATTVPSPTLPVEDQETELANFLMQRNKNAFGTRSSTRLNNKNASSTNNNNLNNNSNISNNNDMIYKGNSFDDIASKVVAPTKPVFQSIPSFDAYNNNNNGNNLKRKSSLDAAYEVYAASKIPKIIPTEEVKQPVFENSPDIDAIRQANDPQQFMTLLQKREEVALQRMDSLQMSIERLLEDAEFSEEALPVNKASKDDTK